MKRVLVQALLWTITAAGVGTLAFGIYFANATFRRYPVTVAKDTIGCSDPQQWMRVVNGRHVISDDSCVSIDKGMQGVLQIRFQNIQSDTAHLFACVKFPIAERCLIMFRDELRDH